MSPKAKATGATPKKAGATPPRRATAAPKDRWPAPFLADLAKYCNVSHAAKAARIDRGTAYRRREADETFARDWDDAIEQGIEALEMKARARAVKSSDTLMIFLLKAHRPERYRDRSSVDITTQGEAIIPTVFRPAAPDETP